MNKAFKICALLSACLGTYHGLYSIFPLNVLRPWDVNLRPTQWKSLNKQVSIYDEFGLKIKAFDAKHGHENVLQLWTKKQDALAMLKGFDENSPYTQYLTNTLMLPVDDGLRGNFNVAGHFAVHASAGLAAYYRLPYHITVSVGLPFYAMKLNHVRFNDLTSQDDLIANVRVRENLTNNFKNRITQFDPKLNLDGWSHIGIGDLGFFAEWRQGFKQRKPYLRDVEIALRGCLTLPTGRKRNDNEILSVPFGYEATGVAFGGGIKLTWFDYVRAGVDLEFLQILGTNGTYRIKVAPNQTDFLFLAKSKAYKEFGFTQRYNVSLETCPVFRGFSAGVAYEFYKHHKDKLKLHNEQFSQKLANSARNLQEWTIHQAIFKLCYDCSYDIADNRTIKPQFLFFYKLPINGTRSLIMSSLGAQITFNF